jgi:DHA1 family vesicular acetylcholine transporter-like MFS transporter 3
MAKSYPQYQWALALCGLILEGTACFFIPFCTNFWVLMLPICIICFGIALIDTALLPMLGFIVDKKYTAVYGSVYAIADISYCAAYAFGPVVAGHVVEKWGFLTLNIIVAVISLIYAPIVWYLKDMHNYKKYDTSAGGYEESVMMGDPPAKEYNTYVMQDGKPQNGGDQYAQVATQETDMIAQSQAGWGDEPVNSNPFRAAPQSNPFRR